MTNPWFVLTFIVIGLPGCDWSGGPIDGQVLEWDTRKPVPDTLVAVKWSGQLALGMADTRSFCYHVAVSRTNNDGRFHIPRWTKPATVAYVARQTSDADIIYKPGFKEFTTGELVNSEDYKNNKIRFLKPDTDSQEQRYVVLKRYFTRISTCDFSRETTGNILPLLDAIYKEAQRLAITADERESTRVMRLTIEDVKRYSVNASGQ